MGVGIEPRRAKQKWAPEFNRKFEYLGRRKFNSIMDPVQQANEGELQRLSESEEVLKHSNAYVCPAPAGGGRTVVTPAVPVRSFSEGGEPVPTGVKPCTVPAPSVTRKSAYILEVLFLLWQRKRPPPRGAGVISVDAGLKQQRAFERVGLPRTRFAAERHRQRHRDSGSWPAESG